VLYDTADFDGAIENWSQAYALATEQQSPVAPFILVEIADAHERAYAIDGDPAHRSKAKAALENFVTAAEARTPMSEELGAAVRAAQRDIERLGQPIAEPEPEPPPVAFADTKRPPTGGFLYITERGPPPTAEQIERNRRLSEQSRKADILFIAGGVMGSLAYVAVIAGGITIVATYRDTASRDVGYGLLGGGAAFAVAGTVMFGIGAHRRLQLKRASAQ
jgi:hypothetical protein